MMIEEVTTEDITTVAMITETTETTEIITETTEETEEITTETETVEKATTTKKEDKDTKRRMEEITEWKSNNPTRVTTEEEREMIREKIDLQEKSSKLLM